VSKEQDTSNVPTNVNCPITIFATYKDEQTRHGKPPSHWPYLHCWTLRELLGLDHNRNDLAETESIDFLIISNFMIDLEILYSRGGTQVAVRSSDARCLSPSFR
jgi:hypothetical protein